MVDKGLPKLLNQTFESATVVNFQNLSSLLTAIAGQMDEMKTEQVSNQPVNTVERRFNQISATRGRSDENAIWMIYYSIYL